MGMSEWRECTLGDVITLRRGHDLPERKRIDGEYPVFSSSGITGYHNEHKIPDSGVITGRYGTIGQVFFAKSAHWPLNTTLYVEDFKGNDKKYVYYFLKMLDWDSFADIASAVPGINRNHVHLARVSIPRSVAEQETIAEILSSLDDKIGLLTRQNATLEALAQTYFRQWFVEGVREDWKAKKLSDFFPVVTGKKDANISTEDGIYPFFTCARDFLYTPSYSFDGSAIILAGNGDFNVKRYSGKFEAYQRTYVLIPYDKIYYNWLYLLVSMNLDDITVGHRGSVINYLTKDMITEFSFPFPPHDISKQLKSLDALFDKIDVNTKQIQTLQKLRDTLLPKLVSGEVKVKGA